ncbi:MAG: hypothetical protein ACRECV_10610 [Xanthobacteraceae bacterium]
MRVAREVFPEIVDLIDLPGVLDVVEHGADLRRGIAIFDLLLNAHDVASSCGGSEVRIILTARLAGKARGKAHGKARCADF